MKTIIRAKVFLWSIWVQIPKPWKWKKYCKIIEDMQQAVKIEGMLDREA